MYKFVFKGPCIIFNINDDDFIQCPTIELSFYISSFFALQNEYHYILNATTNSIKLQLWDYVLSHEICKFNVIY